MSKKSKYGKTVRIRALVAEEDKVALKKYAADTRQTMEEAGGEAVQKLLKEKGWKK